MAPDSELVLENMLLLLRFRKCWIITKRSAWVKFFDCLRLCFPTIKIQSGIGAKKCVKGLWNFMLSRFKAPKGNKLRSIIFQLFLTRIENCVSSVVFFRPDITV